MFKIVFSGIASGGAKQACHALQTFFLLPFSVILDGGRKMEAFCFTPVARLAAKGRGCLHELAKLNACTLSSYATNLFV